MKLPDETIAGARKIVGYWRRVFSEGEELPAGPRRDLVADWATVRDLMALERDEFAAPRAPKSTPAASDDPERGERVCWILQRTWESWASWHADESTDLGFSGEEGPSVDVHGVQTKLVVQPD